MSERAKPLVAAAFMCERVLTEKDSVQTFVRIVDTLIAGSVPPGQAATPFQIWLVVMLKSGQARGKYVLTLRMNSPSGKSSPMGEALPFALSGDEDAVNINALLVLSAAEQGRYRIDILIDDDVLTQVPFTVRLGSSVGPESEPLTPSESSDAPE